MSDPQPRPEAGRPLHRSNEAIRAAIVAVLAAALILGGLIDRSRGPAAPISDSASVAPVPVAAPAEALSSSWFCAGATDDHGGSSAHPRTGSSRGSAPGAVIIANSGSAPASGVITLVP